MPATFPKPWRVVEKAECLIVEDAAGFQICWLYFETREPHRIIGEERMTKQQARVIAGKIAGLGQ